MDKRSKYNELAKYIDLFSNLNVHVSFGQHAPHKPIMLLTVISLIDSGEIWQNVIQPTDKLKTIFEALWVNYGHDNTTYDIAPWTPFWHLKNEPFWHFKPKKDGFDIDSLTAPGQTAKIGDIHDNLEYAYLDQELFELLQDKGIRDILKHQLIDMYLS